MTATDTLLESLQADVLAVLVNCPDLSDANIIPEDAGDMEKEILRRLGTLTGGPTAKRGLVIVVMLPEITAAEPHLPGPAVRLSQEIQIIESPALNRGIGGTGIRSSVAALRTLSALHLRGMGSCAVHAGEGAVKPVNVRSGFLSHTVRLQIAYRGLIPAPKPAAVGAQWLTGPGTLQLTCATVGAQIRTTTDGSFPAPSNPASSIYTVPMPGLTPGTLVRAAAYATGSVPGDITEVTITA